MEIPKKEWAKRWPHITFRENSFNASLGWFAETSGPGSGYHFNGTIDEAFAKQLDRAEWEGALKAWCMEKWPHLYFGVTGAHVSAWVRRADSKGNPDGGEATGFSCQTWTTDNLPPEAIEELDVLNAEAGKAREPGMFYCSGHKCAEPSSEYGYFHFAGSYCREYGKEHPDKYRAAMSENYN